MADRGAEALIDAVACDPGGSALLIDFDGTLATIVSKPSDADLEAEHVDLLHRLSRLVKVLAIVSGRPGTFLADRLEFASHPGTRLIAYGRGGLDYVTVSGEIDRDDSLDRWLPTMDKIADDARHLAPEALIESKGVVITLHWRAAPSSEAVLRAFAARAVDEFGLSARDGKMSLELFPHEVPSKSSVTGDLGRDAHVVAFIGDDFGDLEAFDALDRLERSAQTFRGCVAGEGVPEEMLIRADFVLESPDDTIALLERLETKLVS